MTQAIAKLVFYENGSCNMDKTKSGCSGAAGTYVPYFGTLCTAASDRQRERAPLVLSILHEPSFTRASFAIACDIEKGEKNNENHRADT